MAAPEDTELTALRNQVSSLQRRVDMAALHQSGSREEPTYPSDAPAAPSNDPAALSPPVRPPTPEEEAEGFNIYFGKLDQRRNGEPRDASWQTKVERRVRDVLTGQLERSKLQATECGNTLCRLEVQHQDLSAQIAFMEQFHH